MSYVSYDDIVEQQKYWKTMDIPEKEREALIELSDKFMHKQINNHHELDGLILLYPDDCDNINAFNYFSTFVGAINTFRDDGKRGIKMERFGMKKVEFDVE